MAIFLGLILSRNISVPVEQLRDLSISVRKGNLDAKVEFQSTDEIGELAVAFNRMVLDLKEKTEALKHSNSFLDNIINSMPDTLMVLLKDGSIRTVNTATSKLLEYPLDELLVKNINEISKFDIKRDANRSTHAFILPGIPQYGEATYITKSGKKIPMQFSGAHMKDDNDNIQGIVCVAKDITERKRLEAQIIQSSKLASVGQITVGIAHELNQPLGVITMSSELGQEDIDETEYKRALERFETIKKEVRRSTTIIDQLRNFGRESSQHPREPININTMITESLIFFETQFQLQGIKIIKELPENLPAVVCNRIQIEQILTNLLKNAQDSFGDNNSKKEVKVRTFVIENRVGVEITDSGSGIPQENLHNIFDPFYTTKEHGKGTGLGLSISDDIVKDHGGTIEVSSSTENGTVFTVILPIQDQGVRNG